MGRESRRERRPVTMGRIIQSLLVIVMVTALPLTGHAVGNSWTISHQGYMTDTGGTPLNGTVAILFKLYDSGGTNLWTENHPTVNVSNGVYSVELGASTTLTSLAFTSDYYLGVKVGANSEMTPRHLLTAVPLALRARTISGEGLYTKRCDQPVHGNSCSCNAGDTVLMGSGNCPGDFYTITKSRPVDGDTWEVECSTHEDPTFTMFAGSVWILCRK